MAGANGSHAANPEKGRRYEEKDPGQKIAGNSNSPNYIAMKLKITGYILCFFFMAIFFAQSQRILTEAKLTYNVIPLPENGQETLAAAFKNATYTVWLRGNMARIDFFSQTRQQSVIYNTTTGHATLLRESGDEKYQWNLDSAQWKVFNKKWTPTSFRETGETAMLENYNCTRVIAHYSGGDSASIFYTTQISPLASGYDPMFEGLRGIPVQYEWVIGGLKMRYRLESVQTGPVGALRFDLPKTGYKIIEAPAERPQ